MMIWSSGHLNIAFSSHNFHENYRNTHLCSHNGDQFVEPQKSCIQHVDEGLVHMLSECTRELPQSIWLLHWVYSIADFPGRIGDSLIVLPNWIFKIFWVCSLVIKKISATAIIYFIFFYANKTTKTQLPIILSWKRELQIFFDKISIITS